MIDLPYTFGEKVRAEIDKKRSKNKLPTPEEIKKLYNKNEHFLEEEFDLVEELYITEESINFLHLFKNVKSLIIACSYQFTNEQVKEIINRFPNLQSLQIANQNQITYIDLEKQSNLEDVIIRSNKNLSRINGIRELSNLYELSIYDNPELLEVYRKIICAKAARETLHGTRCKLDILYIPEFLDLMPSSISKEQLELLDLRFVEQLKDNIELERLEHRVTESLFVYEKAKEIVEKYTKETDSSKQKFAIINEWLCQNVKYDYDGINKRVHVLNGQQRGKKGGTNSCFNAILYKSCVCQGYTKAAQLLLKIAGIETSDVECIATEDESVRRTFTFGEKKMSYSDHSILRVKLDDEEYYSDITWDAGYLQSGISRKYFLLSKEEISIDHKLINEDNIETNSKVSLVEEEQLLEFAKKRIAEVDEKKVTK